MQRKSGTPHVWALHPSLLIQDKLLAVKTCETIQKGARVLISLWDSLMFGRVPKNGAAFLGTLPNISESHSEISTRVPFCITHRAEHGHRGALRPDQHLPCAHTMTMPCSFSCSLLRSLWSTAGLVPRSGPSWARCTGSVFDTGAVLSQRGRTEKLQHVGCRAERVAARPEPRVLDVMRVVAHLGC